MVELLVTMKVRNCKPDNITLATMIQAYRAQGMIEAAEDLQNKIIADEDNSGVHLAKFYLLLVNEACSSLYIVSL